MKILDTLFKMTKRRFRFRGQKMCITRENEIRVSIILKMLIFHPFKASGSTFSRLHQRLLKSFKEAAISLRHLEKSNLFQHRLQPALLPSNALDVGSYTAERAYTPAPQCPGGRFQHRINSLHPCHTVPGR